MEPKPFPELNWNVFTFFHLIIVLCRSHTDHCWRWSSAPNFSLRKREKKPEKGREAAAPSNIKEIQEIQGGQEAPLDGDAISPKDA
jgi:hypothetical protein